MPSISLQRWFSQRARNLDQMEAAHQAIGGASRGRRYAVEQINHAYAVLLSSQFQGFCRDLHSEAANIVLGHALVAPVRALLTPALTHGRKLDVGNPNPGNIGSDFNRFGLLFWDEVRSAYAYGNTWHDRLQQLSVWRNAIAHQDFDEQVLGGKVLRLASVRSWRRACDGLSRGFDVVMSRHLRSIIGARAW